MKLFSPKRGLGEEARLRHIEDRLVDLTRTLLQQSRASAAADVTQAAADTSGVDSPTFGPSAAGGGVVTEIEGVPIPAPSGADDQGLVQYDLTSGSFRYWQQTGFLSEAFVRPDLSHASVGSYLYVYYPMYDDPESLQQHTGILVPKAGQILGLSVILSGGVGLGASYTVEATVGSVPLATPVRATITGTYGTEYTAYVSGYSGSFAAGSVLSVVDSTTGSPAAVSSRAWLLMKFS